jgi:hypothetical protein
MNNTISTSPAKTFSITSGIVKMTGDLDRYTAIDSMKEALKNDTIIAEFAKHGITIESLRVIPLYTFDRNVAVNLSNQKGIDITLVHNKESQVISVMSDIITEDDPLVTVTHKYKKELLRTHVDKSEFKLAGQTSSINDTLTIIFNKVEVSLILSDDFLTLSVNERIDQNTTEEITSSKTPWHELFTNS